MRISTEINKGFKDAASKQRYFSFLNNFISSSYFVQMQKL